MQLSFGELRRAKKVSQQDLADKCGISVMTIRSWEERPELIRMGYVPIIAEALGVDPKDVIFLPSRDN